jgi:two-component system cell cycle response regulator DivK
MSTQGRPEGEQQSAQHEGTPASKWRVLIVDDSPATLDLSAFVLNAAGFAVQSTADADSAVLQVGLFKPDLILMDVQMPGVDGLELTRRLKADSATIHIVVVAFTAFAMRGDEAKMRAAGCDGYIAKPFDVATFADTVLSYLHARGDNQATAQWPDRTSVLGGL